MPKVLDLPTIKELYKAGAHFGHLRSRSDARSRDFIFTYRNRVAVIDLEKAIKSIETTLQFIQRVSQEGGQFIFVGTKMQAKDEIKRVADELKMPYIIERWPGGLITNFEVVDKSIKKMMKTEKDLSENKLDHLKKKERLKIEKDLAKTRKIFGGLSTMSQKPDALIVIDAKEELIAINEAKKANVPIIAICDTNSNPRSIEYPIVVNDDSRSTIILIMNLIQQTIKQNFKSKRIESDEAGERAKKALDPKPTPKAKKETVK